MEISRRAMLGGVAALAATGPAMGQRRGAAPGWFDRAIVIDGLGGVADPYGGEGITRMSDRAFAETMATGVTMLRDTVFPVGNVADPWGDYQKARDENASYLGANPDRLLLVRSAADILKAKREKKFAVMVGTQDSCMIGGELDRVAQLKKDGVMSVQLTYNNRNLCGDGALEPANAGLSKLGRATIERVEAEKLLLDLSHGGARTMAEGAAQAKRPLVISHTGARAVTDHPRNTADSTIKAVADKGGVVGVYFMPFLRIGSPARLEDVVAHVEHVARVAGEDHVGIGTDNGVLPQGTTPEARKRNDDYTAQRIKLGIASPGEGVGIYPWIDDLNTIDRYRRFAGVLAARGWSVGRLEKLFGGNFLRVYREAWGG
ncbi:membrane dipeptidase [Sphingomonas sp.]|uniref:dipeptidase n=1 Tax=Sphingomonas sp. TaxID=28214 RepID=UPI00286C14F3|nr:membrane dipeptidase [Sphingomonas sp.]